MRTNRAYSIREHFSAVRKYFITKLSLFFLKFFNSQSLTIIRDGGFGDAIMASSVVKAIQHKYPKARILVSSGFPEMFDNVQFTEHSRLTFPVIWLSYSHYDFFPWTIRKPLHCRLIMEEMAGVLNEHKNHQAISIDERGYKDFLRDHVENKKYLVIQSGAGAWFQEKNWDQNKWLQLVEELKAMGYAVYHIGTQDNAPIEGVVDFRGKTNIYESLLLVKHAKLLIGVNSFAEQAAWVFNVPSVILYGPTNPRYSLNHGQVAVFSNQAFEYRDLFNLPYQFQNMNSIEVKTVLNAASTILNQVN